MNDSTIFIGEVPIILSDAYQYIQKEFEASEEFVKETESKINLYKMLHEESKDHLRKRVFNKIVNGLKSNLALGNEQVLVLGDFLKSNNIKIQAKDLKRFPQYGLKNFNYLRTDWANTKEGELQITTIESIIQGWIEKYARGNKDALILGAGTGRYAFDLAPLFEHLTAIERCFAYIYFFYKLRESPIIFYDINIARPISIDTCTMRYEASLPPNRSNLDNLSFYLADALDLPLTDNSVDTIISIYFTDILPLSDLFQEVNRVLKSGGIFIHLGPLHYHFMQEKPEFALTPEEIREYFIRNGYKIETEQHFEIRFFDSPFICRYEVHRIWGFVLTKI